MANIFNRYLCVYFMYKWETIYSKVFTLNIRVSCSPNLAPIYILCAAALFLKQWNFRNMESRIAKQCSFTLYIGGTHPLDCIIIHQTLHRDNDNVINSTLLERNNCLDWLITYEQMQLPSKHIFKISSLLLRFRTFVNQKSIFFCFV